MLSRGALLRSSSSRSFRRLSFVSNARFTSASIPQSTVIEPNSASDAATTTTLTHESFLYILRKLEKDPGKALAFFDHASSALAFRPGPAAYNVMLRTLAHKDFLPRFWSLAKKMEKLRLPIDGGTYFTALVSLKRQNLVSDAAELAKFYSRVKAKNSVDDKTTTAIEIIASSEEWDGEVEKKLEEMKLCLSESVVGEVLHGLRRRPRKALAFFRWAESKESYKHGASAYNAALRVLGREESMEQFWELVEEAKHRGYGMDIDTYIKLLRQFLKDRMLNDAIGIYELMMDSSYKPSVQDCGLLLRHISLADPPDLDLVDRVVKKYEKNGNPMSKIVYDGILRSLTRIGEFDEVWRIIEKMKAAGFEPDNITYSQMVFGLCRAKRFDDACKVLEDMEACGCMPDVQTWTVLIQGHCSAGEVDAAMVCLTKMIAKNYEPDGELLDIMVKGLCCSNRALDAYTLFVEMVWKANTKPRQATFKYLIQNLLDGRKLEEALKLLVTMKKHQFPPFADPFSPYISKFGTVEDAKEFLKALNAKDCPSPAAYLFLFKSFFNEGRYSEAQDLLFKSPHHIRKHSDITKLFGSIQPGNAT